MHFHVYHNRLKTYGASLGRLISIPRCNGDSRRRNCIESFKTKFTCEWSECGEQFIKVQQFFAHVNYHVQDQFPLGKKSTKQELQCQWAGCTQTYKRCSLALEHVRRHSTERSIGCYTCGAMFGSRLKYIDHCKRQVDYHSAFWVSKKVQQVLRFPFSRSRIWLSGLWQAVCFDAIDD